MKSLFTIHGGVAWGNVNDVELLEVVSHFELLEGSRSSTNRHHPFVSVLTISLMAVLSGADGITAIRQCAEAKSGFLISVFDLSKTRSANGCVSSRDDGVGPAAVSSLLCRLVQFFAT